MSAALAVSEPDLDTSIGTPIRKILDTVAEAISEAYADRYLLQYQYDIDSRSGADLDAFVALFGFARIPARRASGTVLFQRSTVATQSTVIPAGTQLATADSPAVIVQTMSPVIFPQSSLSVTSPVQAVSGGANSNLAANSIVRLVSPVEGVGAVSNPSSLTGGTDGESDSQLRDRFKRTLFRNLAGTEDMYLGVAINDPDVSAAVVLGPSEKYRERIEVVGGTATSTITLLDRERVPLVITAATNATPIAITTRTVHGFRPGDIVDISGALGNTAANGTFRVKAVSSTTSFTLRSLDDTADVAGTGAYTADSGTAFAVTHCKYIYDSGYAFGRDLDNGDMFTPGVHYSLNTSVIPPVLTVLDATNVPDGVYDLSINFAPIGSRSDAVKGITNRVDVWTTGNRPIAATEMTLLDGTSLFTGTATDAYAASRFKRLDGTNPTIGNVFVPLGLRPVLVAPTTIQTGSDTISTGIRVVREVGAAYGSALALDGLEIDAAEMQTTALNIASSTNATPIVVTTSGAHTFQVGQKVKIEGHATNTAANGVQTIQAVTSTTLTLQGTVGVGVGGATGTVKLYSPVSIDYTYNDIPRSTQVQIEGWRMATTDTLVHHGKQLNLRVHAAVILRPGYSVTSVQAAVNTNVSTFLDRLGFGATMQVSDLLNVIGDVVGVDAVRLLTSDDMTAWTITAATNATPIVLTTSAPHNLVANDLVVVDSVAGNTAANGQWVVQSVTSTTITLKESVGNDAYTSGGRAIRGDFGLKVMSDDTTTAYPVKMFLGGDGTPYRSKDIYADDFEYFVLESVVLTAKAGNTFGVAG